MNFKQLIGIDYKPKVKLWLDFIPKKNITTYELALATKFLVIMSMYKHYSAEFHQAMFDELDKKVKRHFKVK